MTRPRMQRDVGVHVVQPADVLRRQHVLRRPDGDETARVLLVSTNASPDVSEYPDTGKVGINLGGAYRFHRVGDAVDNAGPE